MLKVSFDHGRLYVPLARRHKGCNGMSLLVARSKVPEEKSVKTMKEGYEGEHSLPGERRRFLGARRSSGAQ